MTFEEYKEKENSIGSLSVSLWRLLSDSGIGCKHCRRECGYRDVGGRTNICKNFLLYESDFEFDDDGLQSIFSDNSSELALILKSL